MVNFHYHSENRAVSRLLPSMVPKRSLFGADTRYHLSLLKKGTEQGILGERYYDAVSVHLKGGSMGRGRISQQHTSFFWSFFSLCEPSEITRRIIERRHWLASNVPTQPAPYVEKPVNWSQHMLPGQWDRVRTPLRLLKYIPSHYALRTTTKARERVPWTHAEEVFSDNRRDDGHTTTQRYSQ